MIWFDIKALENKITNNELSDKDGFYYLLAYFIFTLITLSSVANKFNGWLMLCECAISVLITIWGLRTIYELNNEIDGKDFFKRFFAINWVIGMRILIVIIPLAFFFGILCGIIAVKNNIELHEPNPQWGILSLTFKAFFTLICYLLIINSFKRLKIYR
jgi:hypothetical protein